MTAEEKNTILVSAFAEDAEVNVACELNAWNWPVSLEAAAQLGTRFPNQNSFCIDADNDRYSPAQGDRNDFNLAIRPSAIETINGLDDDADGIVDDVLFNEVDAASQPMLIQHNA
ncbi:MAG: hypothetical protein ABJA18_13170 [bacterium]